MPPDDVEATAPWNEYRHLVLSQLRTLNAAFEKLVVTIDSLDDKGRDRDVALTAWVTKEVSAMLVRIAMLEVRATIWGGMVGMVGGGIVSFVIEKLLK